MKSVANCIMKGCYLKFVYMLLLSVGDQYLKFITEKSFEKSSFKTCCISKPSELNQQYSWTLYAGSESSGYKYAQTVS